MSTRNAIFTTLHGVSYEFVRLFIESLKQTGFKGKLIAFVSAVDEDSLTKLKSAGVWTVPFYFPGKHVRQRWCARLTPLWRLVFAGNALLPQKEKLAHILFHLYFRRHLLYLDFLRAHRTEFDRVFLTDCRDVYFQADPFSWDPEPGVHLFFEEASHIIGKCPTHRRWFMSMYGQETFSEMSNNTISCAGTTFGDTESLIKYLSLMVHYSMHIRSFEQHDGDQAVHNYLLHKNLIPSVCVHDNRTGPVFTMGAVPPEEIRFDERNLIVNDINQVIPVLHQYDRIKGLPESLAQKLCGLGNL